MFNVTHVQLLWQQQGGSTTGPHSDSFPRPGVNKLLTAGAKAGQVGSDKTAETPKGLNGPAAWRACTSVPVITSDVITLQIKTPFTNGKGGISKQRKQNKTKKTPVEVTNCDKSCSRRGDKDVTFDAPRVINSLRETLPCAAGTCASSQTPSCPRLRTPG